MLTQQVLTVLPGRILPFIIRLKKCLLIITIYMLSWKGDRASIFFQVLNMKSAKKCVHSNLTLVIQNEMSF